MRSFASIKTLILVKEDITVPFSSVTRQLNQKWRIKREKSNIEFVSILHFLLIRVKRNSNFDLQISTINSKRYGTNNIWDTERSRY